MSDRIRRRWPRSRLQLQHLAWWLQSKLWTRWLAKEFESFGSDSVLLRPCWLWGIGDISIGDRVQIGPACRMGALRGAKLTIGDQCEIVGGCSFSAQTEGIEIGRSVLMAWNVQIYDHQHGTSDPNRPIREQGVVRGGEVRVLDGAWLGANVVVMPGVTIGRNAVVGANSVVTRNIPDLATATGAPAQVTGAGEARNG